jgi:hypothetical protein
MPASKYGMVQIVHVGVHGLLAVTRLHRAVAIQLPGSLRETQFDLPKIMPDQLLAIWSILLTLKKIDRGYT